MAINNKPPTSRNSARLFRYHDAYVPGIEFDRVAREN